MGGLVDEAITAMVNTLTAATLSALMWVLRMLAGTVFHSPDVTVLPQVRYVAGQAQTVANACMGLAVMVVGLLTMTHGGLQERYTAKAMLPRLLVGFTVANFAAPIVSVAITAANALTQALSGQRFDAAAAFTQLRRVVVGAATSPSQALLALVLRELVFILLLVLLGTWLVRIGLLILLAATAPLALACHGLEVTEAVASIWWRTLLVALGTQVLQAVTLQMAVSVLLVPAASLPALGVPQDPDGLINLVVAALLLWMVVRVPGWLSRQAAASGGRRLSSLGHVLRILLVQQLVRGSGLLRRRRGPPSPVGPRPSLMYPRRQQYVYAARQVNSPRPGHVHPRPARPRPAGTGRPDTARPSAPRRRGTATGTGWPDADPPRRGPREGGG